ncbi:hypothetical protein JTB14_038184 [Gonioctena quinquepunctata]|nr:hypothetical protein JTB14_038184 [Gonioctena quinquepunctata]
MELFLNALSSLMYIEDLELFGGNKRQLNNLLKITGTSSDAIGLEKCKTSCVDERELTSHSFQMKPKNAFRTMEE